MPDGETQEKNNIIFDPSCLRKDSVEYSTSEVECPELNELMGVTEGNVIFKVRQATLDEFYRARSGDGADQVLVISERLQQAAFNKDSDQIADVLKDLYGLNKELLPETAVQVNLCEMCIVEPKLSRDQVIEISKFYPFVVARIANEILRLTNVGGIKKNS
jgi:hypothetical protein